MNLRFACVWTNGHLGSLYGVEYVEKLRNMLEHEVGMFTDLHCLTDRPELLPPRVIPVKVPTPREQYGWWSKIHLFDRRHFQNCRVVYFDLDVLLVDEIWEIVNSSSSFAIAPDADSAFQGKGGLEVVKRYNSSVMVWDAAAGYDIYEKYNGDVSKRFWGDQDWIAHLKPDLTLLPKEWFPRISQCGDKWQAPAKVVLCKKPKNVEAAVRWPRVAEIWR